MLAGGRSSVVLAPGLLPGSIGADDHLLEGKRGTGTKLLHVRCNAPP